MSNQRKTVARNRVLKEQKIPETQTEIQLRNIASSLVDDLYNDNLHSMVAIFATVKPEKGIEFKMYYTDIMSVETLLNTGLDKLSMGGGTDYDE